MRKRVTGCLVYIFGFLTALVGYAQPSQPLAPTSVLSTGQWIKLGITDSGIYKIDRKWLQAAGLAPDAIDPRQLKIYGNGGGMLPQLNSAPRPDDLIQNAILVAGEADGKFDPNDYLLFYGQGPHRWFYEPGSQRFNHAFNIYADTAYYLLTISNSQGRRVPEQVEVTSANVVIETYLQRQFHEQDLISPLQSGREWYGEEFNLFTTARNFTFPLVDLVPGSAILVSSAVMASSKNTSEFTLKANNIQIGSQLINGQGIHNYHPVGTNSLDHFTLNSNIFSGQSVISLNLTFDPKGTTDALAYLNYLEITSEHYLKQSGTQTTFRSKQNIGVGAVSTFRIENITAATSVWDVTQPGRPQAMRLQKNKDVALFTVKTDSLREFISFTGTDFPQPRLAGKIANQNLHALNLNGTLDLVILTHPTFRAVAEKLAQHRRTHNNLNTEVVTVNQVYNEFSSGAADVTAIRDFMRMLHQRSRKPPGEALNLLLFGDCSFDYKSAPGKAHTRTPFNTNHVPVYESRQSLDPLRSYSSEDYYGLLDSHEGLWLEEDFTTPELLDIGIGRLPVKTAAEAHTLVAKLMHYDSPASFGNWRSQITFLADDGDGAAHLRDAENLSTYLDENAPAYNIKKIYLDRYKQTAVTNGQLSSETNAALDKAVAQGTLLLNYTGHGNETSLAHEKILTLPQLAGWKNYDRLPFMLTATCEFGRYDDPRRSSGAELALLNSQGGAIGLLTTTRPVYATNNRLLNRQFFEAVFTPINGRMPRLGDLYRLTKNQSQAQANNRNFTLLGDPSQQLAYPALKAIITGINQAAVTTGITDTLNAAVPINLTGTVTNEQGNILTSFQGQVVVKIFAPPGTFKTLGDESAPGSGNIQTVQVRENILFNGLATVKNGQFTVSFRLPKDAGNLAGKGKISLYAFNATTDAHGGQANVAVGDAVNQPATDSTPPTIKLYLHDETFLSGGITGKNPEVLAKFYDASGINITTGQGHEIKGILDGDTTRTIILNEFYTAEPDNFKAGQARYFLSDLTPGSHELKIKAWDIYNNAAEARLVFIVTGAETIRLKDILNYPNPFPDNTNFSFNHNRAGEGLDIQIQIFDLTGKLVKTIREKRLYSQNHIADLLWNGQDDRGHLLTNGVYLYKIKITSLTNGISTERFNKLMILK